ncbi:hypothetical protein T06_4043 [Trichinella sp. T6]|nr:hypothetical protein T06_4043 [Trichinella sp. T6]
MAMWNRRLTLTELQSTRHHRNAQQAKQSVIFVPQRSRLTLFGEKRNKRPKKIPRDLEIILSLNGRNLPARCSKSKNGNSLVGKIAPNDTEAIPRHNIEAFVRACIAPSLSSLSKLENSVSEAVGKHSFLDALE